MTVSHSFIGRPLPESNGAPSLLATSDATRSRGSFTTSRSPLSIAKIEPPTFSAVEPNVRPPLGGCTPGMAANSSTNAANRAWASTGVVHLLQEVDRKRPVRSPAVRTGDDLQEVAVGVFPIDAPTPVLGVVLSRPLPAGVRPVRQLPVLDPAEDLVELGLGDLERVKLPVTHPMHHLLLH